MTTAEETVGSPQPRVDGHAKVSGEALYIDDITMPGMLFGRTVRSEVPHARLKGITLDFQDGLQGKGFVFGNPNATNTCGCGESFSV